MTGERLSENLETVLATIAESANRAGRDPRDVRLVAVTKRRPADLVRALHDLGIRDFGENYPQELWEKTEALADLDVRWHLIGHLQGNKARKTMPKVQMIHGVDSLKLLQMLDDLAATVADPPSVCLQVNGSGEASKHGWSAETLLRDAETIASLRAIPIIGLMTMAGYDTDAETARPTFASLRELRDRMRAATGLPMPHLSMGMSNDFVSAVEEGATLVRVGSALFEGIDS